MFSIKNFLARVNIPELYRLKFSLNRTKTGKTTTTFFPSNYMSETLYVTSSKAILVTHFTSWENVF